jgi:hypothetical protein
MAQPLTLQVTAVLLSVEVTVGVNCCVPPAGTLALVGVIEMVTVGAVSVTTAGAAFVVSATEVAVTETVVVLGSFAGAVYKPLVLTVPITASPPVSPFTLQVTEVFVEPVTVAVNCCVAAPATLAVVGEIVTATVVEEEELLLPPHPAQAIIASTTGRNRFIRKSPLPQRKGMNRQPWSK